MRKHKMPRSFLALFLLMATAAPAFAQESQTACLRMAFGKFCLGGPASSLPPKPAYVNGDSMGWGTPGDGTLVKLFSGRVMSAFRSYKPATWLTFDDLERDLRKVFGEPLDSSTFPSYADTREARATSILIGKGRAHLTWKPTDDYHVSLMWSRDGLSVTYLVDELQRRQDAVTKPKF